MKINFNPIILNTISYKKYSNKEKPSFNEVSCPNYPASSIFQTVAIHFTGDDCFFSVTKIPSMRCPVCEQIMLNNSQIEEFIKEASSKKGDELIKVFEKYEDDRNFALSREIGGKKSVFRPKQQKIVDTIKRLAKQYPSYSLRALVNKKAIELKKSNYNDRSNYTNNFFLNAKSKNLSSELIASKIISPSATSKEHIHPRAKGGVDALSNYLCDCSNCNGTRRELDFYLWQKEHPEMAKNLQAYIYDIKGGIEAGYLDFERYNNYIENLIKTIKKESHGEIVLEKPAMADCYKNCGAKFEGRRAKIISIQ